MRFYYILLSIYFCVLIWSGIAPHDYFTWILEVFPAILGLLILIFTFKKFQFTKLTYSLILIHCLILFIGGHYTYAEVPVFEYLKDALHQTRNNYDKVGHFAQGFVPAAIVHELFIRKNVVKESWLKFLTIATCITISSLYEFLEWFVAIASGQSAESFLGTQGYVWDTQSDMLYATIGAITFLIVLSKIQNQQINNIINSSKSESK